MQTLNAANLASATIPFPGGSGEMVWDAASSGTGTLLLERMSDAAGTSSTWTPVGTSSAGQLSAAGTLIFTAGPCLLRMRAAGLSTGASILCDVQRCHAGRVHQD